MNPIIQDSRLFCEDCHTIKPKDHVWIWRHVIPRQAFVLLYGDPGSGKSTLMSSVISRVSTGTPFPDSSPCPQGTTLIFTTEEDPATDFIPRLLSAEADLKHVKYVSRICSPDGQPQTPLSTLNNETSILFLRNTLDQYKSTSHPVRLILLDPAIAFTGPNFNENCYSDVYSYIERLHTVAVDYDLAIVGLTHANKKQDLNPIYRGTGSTAWVAASRAAWWVRRESQESDRCCLQNIRGSRTGATGVIPFTLVQTPIPESYNISDPPVSACIASSRMTIEEWESENASPNGRPPREREQAEDWLWSLLSVEAPIPAREIVERASAEGISQMTLTRAKKSLKVRSIKHSTQEGSITKAIWLWSLPDQI